MACSVRDGGDRDVVGDAVACPAQQVLRAGAGVRLDLGQRRAAEPDGGDRGQLRDAGDRRQPGVLALGEVDRGERYSYSDARILSSLSERPRRIGELAQLEGLAQPTTTLLVKRLEEQGLLRRERQTHDQRVVLASLTDAGQAALEGLRALAATGLRKHLDAMPDQQLSALTAATDALAELITALQSDTSRR
jgi:DNA-binding MarR family transcriptional regulator